MRTIGGEIQYIQKFVYIKFSNIICKLKKEKKLNRDL